MTCNFTIRQTQKRAAERERVFSNDYYVIYLLWYNIFPGMPSQALTAWSILSVENAQSSQLNGEMVCGIVMLSYLMLPTVYDS